MVNVLFFKQSGKEFHAAEPVQEKGRLPYVESRHLGTSRSPRVAVMLSAVDGALRCCGSAGTVQTSMAVQCSVDTCRP